MHILDLSLLLFLGFSTEVLPKSQTNSPNKINNSTVDDWNALKPLRCCWSTQDFLVYILLSFPFKHQLMFLSWMRKHNSMEKHSTPSTLLVRNLQCCNNESISVGTTACFLECFSSLKSTPTNWTVWYHCRTSHFKLCSSNLAMVGSFMTFGCQTGPAKLLHI